MYQGTTPAVSYEIKGYDLTDATIFVSFKRNSDVLTKTGSDVIAAYDSDSQISTIICQLTQEETLAIKSGGVQTQIRFIYENGQAYATNVKTLEMKSVIYTDVIHYDGGDDS